MALEWIGADAFDGERLARRGRWAVAFLATWCPFCREFLPEFEAFPKSAETRLVVADMTSEESPLWDRFKIEVVPTVVVFEDGVPVFRADGVRGEGLGDRDRVRLRAVLAAEPSAGPVRPTTPASRK
jgi:thioredoxin 1